MRRESGVPFGTVPYGYIRHRGKLVAHPVEMDVVTLILQLRSKGMGYCAIAGKLNARGIKPRDAAKWDHSTVRNIIKRAGNQV